MTERVLNIKYQCLHPSCQVFCKKGEFVISESFFNELSTATDDEDTFKSPPGACRMGFSQQYRLIAVQEEGAETEAEGEAARESLGADDPLTILKAEHQEVLKKLDTLEYQVRKRDLEGLWVTTSMIENDILLHSIKKEEDVLFPVVEKKIPAGANLMPIMKEDHVEFISILHGFRYALQDGEILDGILNTLIVNLRNHIKKEDEEFFHIVDEHLDNEDRKRIAEGMRKMEEEHVPLEPGDRKDKGLSPYSEDRKKLDAEIAALKSISSVGGEEMCCGGH